MKTNKYSNNGCSVVDVPKKDLQKVLEDVSKYQTKLLKKAKLI